MPSGLNHQVSLVSRSIADFFSDIYSPFLSAPMNNAIKPEASMTIYWTMVLINTFAVVGSMPSRLKASVGRARRSDRNIERSSNGLVVRLFAA